jgi:hypothetical protein
MLYFVELIIILLPPVSSKFFSHSLLNFCSGTTQAHRHNKSQNVIFGSPELKRIKKVPGFIVHPSFSLQHAQHQHRTGRDPDDLLCHRAKDKMVED